MTAISDLDIFARVARTGNMSAAGREMGLSPAVVSKRISQLEERLGARLFQRTTRHLTLTETGAGYFKRVVDILSLCEEAEDFVSRRNTKPRGLLKVTMPTAFSRLHIAPYINNFLARYPEIELDVHIGDAFVDIIREGFDLAIRIGELEDSSLVARRIASDTRVVCAAPAYLERHGTPIDLVDLEAHNCLAADTAEVWRLEGPDGRDAIPSARQRAVQFRRVHPRAGAGGRRHRSAVDLGHRSGAAQRRHCASFCRNIAPPRVLPCMRSIPSREFMPAKVNVLIEFLAELYGSEPYWDKDLDLNKVAQVRPAARQISRRVGKAGPVAATR